MALRLFGSFSRTFLIFGDGLFAVIQVFVRRSAGNVLAGVGGGEIETSIDEVGIEFLGLLEIFDGLVELGVLESGDTLVEKVARLQLVAAGNAERETEMAAKERSRPGKRERPRGGFPCNRCMSH